MNLIEKLRKASAGINKAKAGLSVGLKTTTISNYLATGSIPRADIALKLSRAVGVPFEWLVDDAQGWPPPSAAPASAGGMTDDELMGEVARRYRVQAVRLRGLIDRLVSIDWREVALSLYRTPISDEWPEHIHKAFAVFEVVAMNVAVAPTLYDARLYAESHHASMPGASMPPGKVDMSKTIAEWAAWADGNQYVKHAQFYWRAVMSSLDTGNPSRSDLERIRIGGLNTIEAGERGSVLPT